MSEVDAVFGKPLQPNSAVAISSPPARNPEPNGPHHKVQFVVEFVGHRSVPATVAAALHSPQWFQALGSPELFAMSPSDQVWQTLTTRTDGSYDSLALAWDLLSANGQLTGSSANHLLKVAEGFASEIQRRAMPLPPPGDVDRLVKALNEIRDGLDIGVEVLLVPHGQEFLEREVWLALAELGFDIGASGFFEFKGPFDSAPLVTVIPTGGRDSFTLGAVQQGIRHPGLMIGFNVPTSPNPEFALDAVFRTADHLRNKLDATAFTDDDLPLDPSTKARLQSYLQDGIQALHRVGIEPGSRAAFKLFGS